MFETTQPTISMNLDCACGDVTLYVLCGPPGCGKSTWAARRFRPSQIVSTDALREMLTDDINSMGHNDVVFDFFYSIIYARLGLGLATVADATQLRATGAWPESPRTRLVEIARLAKARVELFAFDVSLDFCLINNAQRPRCLPDETIEKYCRRFAEQKDNFDAEGFDRVHWLNESYLSADWLGAVRADLRRHDPQDHG
jgi:protein phosphatase